MTATAKDAYLVIGALVDELVRCGMEHACTSPGSRNTPIVLSLARDERLECWSHIDERAAGFFALGAAKASGRPVAVTCTSGTAAANLLPAVVEARHAGVPLIVLTADRPPELRDVGAGQTIDQLKLYGDAVKWFFELGVPEAGDERLRWVRALACRAYWTALSGRPGPVHLNLPLREPLVLEEPLAAELVRSGGRPDGRPWLSQPAVAASPTAAPPLVPAAAVADAAAQRPGRVVLVAGELGGSKDAEAARALGGRLAAFAAQARIPLLADPLSGARSGRAAVAHYDLILRDPGTADSLRPDAVWRIGELPTSKPLRAWLASLGDAEHVLLAPDDRWSDPAARVTKRIVAPPEALIELLQRAELTGPEGWLERWAAADSAVAHAIAAPLRDAGLSEPAAITALAQFLPPTVTLLVGSSMPIRDVEEFFPALNEPPRVISNRGANGIDGTVSTAFGVAATGAEVVLVLGDVTLAHDIGGLLAARRLGLKLTILLLNNSGGGIFNFLPVATQGDAFQRHIATPTGLHFAHAAALYGLDHTPVSSSDELVEALFSALAGSASTLIEVHTERQANRELHAEVETAASRSLDDHGSTGAADPVSR